MTMTGSKMKINPMDFFAFPVFLIAACVNLGLLGSTVMGYDLGAGVSLGAGHSISFASIVAIGTLAYVAYTNDWDGGLTFNSIQGWLILATIGTLIAPPFFPMVADTIASGPAAIVALVVQVGGFVSFSILG